MMLTKLLRTVPPAGLALSWLIAFAACGPANHAPAELDRAGTSADAESASEATVPHRDPANAAADTLRGTIAIVGSEPATFVVLRPVGGGTEVALQGEDAIDLHRLAGVEVVVVGRGEETADRSGVPTRPGAARFVVERFAVRAVDGVPAVDGILVERDDGIFLKLPDDELRRITRPPAEFHAMIGARVWVAGPLDDGVAAYGIIREDRGRIER